jgi:putative molybdopterin biosynthesis protein
MGSHDIALDVVTGALSARGFRARVIAVGSQGGVSALKRGECYIAPVHLVDPETDHYNKHLADKDHELVPGWRRSQGIMFRKGDERFDGKSAQQVLAAALADTSCLMVNRNAGSGTRVLIDKLLNGARPPGYANQPKSHNAVAVSIAQKRSDWGVGIEPVARLYDLDFLPVSPEHFDFLIATAHRERPAVKAFLEALEDPAIRKDIAALGMRFAD